MTKWEYEIIVFDFESGEKEDVFVEIVEAENDQDAFVKLCDIVENSIEDSQDWEYSILDVWE